MKPFLHGLLGAVLLLAGLAGPALGQDGAAERAQNEKHLKEQRAAIDQRLAVRESACYQRFVVSSCLRDARRQAREERTLLQKAENARKEELRRSRAAQHEQNLTERQQQAEEAAPQSDTAHAKPPRAHSAAPLGARAAGPSKAREVQAERARTSAQRALDAKAARERLLDKQRAAELRVQAQQRRQAQLDAKGHPHAAPLPDPP
jgi:colicin import membrane protein